MSRRGRHGRHLHSAPGPRPARAQRPAPERPAPPSEPAGEPVPEDGARPSPADPISPDAVMPDEPAQPLASTPAPIAGAATATRPGAPDERVHLRPWRQPGPDGLAPAAERDGRADGSEERGSAPGPQRGGGDAPRATCTVAQLRRFIKSRPWIPLHELRRRFGISGADDDVTPIRVSGRTLFVGLPAAEGRLVEELLAGGDVGYELSLDPGAPIVVGVYPMRPVPRG